jgi:hypothetical protein
MAGPDDTKDGNSPEQGPAHEAAPSPWDDRRGTIFIPLRSIDFSSGWALDPSDLEAEVRRRLKP